MLISTTLALERRKGLETGLQDAQMKLRFLPRGQGREEKSELTSHKSGLSWTSGDAATLIGRL